MFLQTADKIVINITVMAIYDSQTQSKSTRNSRKFRDLDLDFSRNAVTNDVNIVEDVVAVKRAVKKFSSN